MNRYSNRTVPGANDILGIAHPSATVTVNGNATYRKGDYFHHALTAGNNPSAVWQPVSIGVAGGSTISSNLFTPPASESFTYDDDGNLKTDGRWTYTWDAENRLIQMESFATTPSGSRRKLEFAYDYAASGRRCPSGMAPVTARPMSANSFTTAGT